MFIPPFLNNDRIIPLSETLFLRAFKYYHKPRLKINTKLRGTGQNNAEN